MSRKRGNILIGRSDCVRAYEQALAKPSKAPALEIVGSSGTGKSYLLRYLRDHKTPSHIPNALLDLEQIYLRTDALAISYAIADGLRHAMKPEAWADFQQQYTEEQKSLARLPLQLTINQTIPAQNATVVNAEQSVQASVLIRRAEEHARNVISQSLITAISTIESRPVVIFVDTLERLSESGDRTLKDWLFGHTECVNGFETTPLRI
jgi:type II secretory pathway predicted ATPase ExeA